MAELLYLPCHVASNYVEVSNGCLRIDLHSTMLPQLILKCISMVTWLFAFHHAAPSVSYSRELHLISGR